MIWKPGEEGGKGKGPGMVLGILLTTVLMVSGMAVAPSSARAQGEPGAPAFLMVNPGDPAANPDQAREFLADLGAYLAATVPRFQGRARGLIANTVEGGIALLESEDPVLAFVPAGFYLGPLRAHGPTTPVGQALRFGSAQERYYLVSNRDGPESIEALQGQEVATAFDVDRDYLRRVVFPPDRLPGAHFHLAPAENLADAMFFLLEGDSSAPPALLLDEQLRRFFEADDLVWPEIRIIWTSGPLPPGLAVALGSWTQEELAELGRALFEMAEDPRGLELLQLMESSGFQPVDEALLEAARERYDRGGEG